VVVSEEKGQILGQHHHMKFVATSSKTGEGVDEAFHSLAKLILLGLIVQDEDNA
jgi:hypothetical protein